MMITQRPVRISSSRRLALAALLAAGMGLSAGPASAADPVEACKTGVEIIRLWVRATDPSAPQEERDKVRARVEQANDDCTAAREANPGNGAILLSSAYALFAMGDKAAGVEFIRQAAEAEHPPAMVMMARYMSTGDTVDKDVEGAWSLLIDTLQSDDPSAQVGAALEFLPGGAGPESPKRAKKALQRLIKAGNGEAMVAYAMKVLNLPKATPGGEEAKEALAFLERAAMQAKEGTAMIYLSLLHNQGEVAESSKEKAVAYAQMAIDAGITRAYGTMGQIYQNHGDHKAAVEWFTRGAEAGDGFSQGMLGFMYSGGFGVEQDLDTAVKWWTKGRWNGDRLSAGYLQVRRDKLAAEKAYEEEQKAKQAEKDAGTAQPKKN